MGTRPFKRADAFKFAATSGGAEVLAALVGFFAGAHLIGWVAAIDHWIAFGLLAAISIHMAFEGIAGLKNPSANHEELSFHHFSKVLFVSLATSLDAFGVGVSLGVAHKSVMPYLFSIGFWAFSTTMIGLYLSRRLSKKFGPIFTLIAAATLGVLSLQMLKI